MAQLKDLLVLGPSRFLGNIYGTLKGNADTATKLANARKLKTNLGSTAEAQFDGSADQTNIPVTGTLGVANGGLGRNSLTANRLAWSYSTTELGAGYHYASNTKIAIGSTTEPSQNFYVNGSSFFNGAATIQKDLNIKGNESTDDSTHLKFNASDNTQRAIIAFNGNTTNTLDATTHLKIASSYGDIKINPGSGYINTNGTLYKNYSASNSNPLIWMNGNDYDNYLWQISSGTSTKQYYGYGLKYIGSGSGIGNYLRLNADNQNGTDVIAIGINQNGQVGIGADADSNFRLYSNGNARINGDIVLHNGVNGDSPSLVFSRGTSINGTDTHDDWRMYVTAGALHIQERSGTSDSAVINSWVDNLVVDNQNITLPSTKTANRLMWADNNRSVQSSYHYATTDKVGINSTTEPTENFYVNGSARFGIGTNDNTSHKRFIIGTSGRRYLSFGASGVQAYDANDAASTLYLNYNGGSIEVGTSSNTVTTTMYGSLELPTAGGFNYSGIGAGSDNADRHVWFSYNGIKGRPVYSDKFKYNPSTNILTVGSISGNAATATKLGTSTIGSTTKGIYLNAGAPTAMTYSLGATVNAGTTNRLSYYSGANAISSADKFVINTSNGIMNITNTANVDSGVAIYDTDGTTRTMFFGMGSGNTNHGIYSSKHSKWALQITDTDISLNGNASTATKATQDADGEDIRNRYYKIYNNTFRGNSSSVTVNDLAADGPGYGMINSATDNPLGKAGWIHVLNCAWNRSAASWIGQIALDTSGSKMWYRGNGSSAIAGKAWNTVLGSNNYTDYTVTKTGTGASGTWGINITGYSKSVLDAGNNSSLTTFAYSKAGLNYGDYTWLAAWNGTEMRAVNKSQFAQASHTHSYLPLSGGTMTGGITLRSNFTKGTAPSASSWYNAQTGMVLEAGTGTAVANRFCYFEGNLGTDKSNVVYLRAYESAAGSSNQSYIAISAPNGSTAGRISANVGIYGAVWNDYAEYRNQKEKVEPGYVVLEQDDGKLIKSTARLQKGGAIVSDTFGFAIGETDENKTPLAVSGRVLAYTYEPREMFHAGDAVCTGPDGKVSLMTEEEEERYPLRCIGIVSEIPDYEIWGTGNTKVNNRIWIKVR